MLQYFTLLRYGLINLKNTSSSPVQCAGVEHHLYKYGVAILYTEGLTLGKNRFLIDNNAVDKVVQRVTADSCEAMLIQMTRLVTNRLNREKIKYIGVKIVIRPTVVVDEKIAEFHLTTLKAAKYREEMFGIRIDF